MSKSQSEFPSPKKLCRALHNDTWHEVTKKISWNIEYCEGINLNHLLAARYKFSWISTLSGTPNSWILLRPWTSLPWRCTTRCHLDRNSQSLILRISTWIWLWLTKTGLRYQPIHFISALLSNVMQRLGLNMPSKIRIILESFFWGL